MAGRIYVLLTWTTRARQPLITAEVEVLLTTLLSTIAKRHNARVLAIGIVPDHVHMLLRLPLVLDVPKLVQGLKGASARIANRDGVATTRLAWAGGYDLRSIGLRGLNDARRYVREQKRRHGILPAPTPPRP
jgi:REP element-mobilizing transposase RayT